MDRFVIGDLCLCWDGGEYKLKKGPWFEQFRVETNPGLDPLFVGAKVEALEVYRQWPCVTKTYSYERFVVDGEPLLLYHWGYNLNAFGVWPRRMQADAKNWCLIHPRLTEEVPMTTDWFFGMCGLHRLFLQKHAPILHGAYISYQGKGVIFSAPSQTGKSTQAELWKQYAGAEILNGDRVLLRQRDGVWHSYGYPACGSSRLCVNQTLPVGAIVILEQGQKNEVCSMTMAEKVRSLTVATEVYPWDVWEVEQAMECAKSIAQSVPMVKLKCRPDKEAVRVLQQYLDQEKGRS